MKNKIVNVSRDARHTPCTHAGKSKHTSQLRVMEVQDNNQSDAGIARQGYHVLVYDQIIILC